MTKLLKKYRKEVIPAMQKEFNIENTMAVPRIEKILINTGTGRVAKEDKVTERIAKDVVAISGQKPVFRKAKKSISGFKLREGMNVGISVTLRGKRMYDFMDRLISIALPRSKDFRGIDAKNFDRMGNLNIGIKESSIFPELNYENLKDIFGLEITVVNNAKNKEQGIKLLKLMGFPIKV
ncbi:MAG: 50S ribosomal protein L5 [Candidatus Paceibacterota bacterium]